MKSKLNIVLRITGFFIVYLIVFSGFQLLGGVLSDVSFYDESPMTAWQIFVINLFGFFGTVLVIYLFTRWVDKISFIEIGLHGNHFKDFFKGVILGFMPIVLGFIFLYDIGLIRQVQVHFDGLKLLLIFGAFVFVAFNEEAFFRGYLLRNLRYISGKNTALLISALIFAALHLSNDHIDIIGFTNIFLAGILLGMLYIYTNNLWFPIGMHFAWNLAQSLFGFNVSGESTYTPVTYQLSDEMTWLSGGKFGFEASVLSLVFLVIMMVIIYLMYSGKKHSGSIKK